MNLTENVRGGEICNGTFRQMQVRNNLLVMAHLIVEVATKDSTVGSGATSVYSYAGKNEL